MSQVVLTYNKFYFFFFANILLLQESECEDDIEPKLKYVRISNDLRKILSSDAASCVAVHPKVFFICFKYRC